MSWDKGREAIETMITHETIERVLPSAAQSASLVAEARLHATSAELIVDHDPSGAYVLAYDAARKALLAILAIQGLRPTTSGGHVALYEVVDAQFGASLGGVVRPYNRMRVRRNQIEYPSGSAPAVTPDEVRRDLTKAEGIIDLADHLIATLDPFS